jgi:DNA repair protein RecN (Recombination protein N)
MASTNRRAPQPEAQRDILDAFGGATGDAGAVRAAWDALAAVRSDIHDLDKRRKAAEQRADYLRHVAREIADARLVDGEDDRLADEARRLSHIEELRLHAGHMTEAIDGEESGALRQLGAAQRALDAAVRLDPGLEPLREMLDGAFAQLQELAREVAEYESGLDADPGRLAEVEGRRDLIFRLARKYGGSVESTLTSLREASAELDLLDTAALELGSLSQRAVRAESALGEAARTLSVKRKAAATRLEREMDALLPELGMTGGRFTVALTERLDVDGSGAEGVEFLVALNVGHDARPLSRVASGGELSRVMLALTTILARLDRVPTLVFDEVDSGIGGRVGLSVGDTMRRVAAHHQVLAITHLPQIASRAHQHIVVSKAAKGGVTTADLLVAEGEDRVHEIARMLGGDSESETSRAHARELLEGSAAKPEGQERTAVRRTARRNK